MADAIKGTTLGTKLRKWIIAAATVAAVMAGGYTIGDWSDTRGYPIITAPGDTLWFADSLNLAKFALQQDAVSKTAPVVYTKAVTDLMAKSTYTKTATGIIAYSGKMTVPTMSKGDTIAKPIYDDTLACDAPNDTVDVVWTGAAKWEVVPKDQTKDMLFVGVYAKEYRKAFYVGSLIEIATGKQVPIKAKINDDGTYEQWIPAGYKLDPGYASAPLWIGPSPKYAAGDSTRPLPDTTGDQIVFWFTGDSVKAGKFLNHIGNDTGVATAGAYQVDSGAVGRCAYLNGADSIVWPATAKYALSGQFTMMSWIKPLSDDAGCIIGNLASDDTTGYSLTWQTAGANKLGIYGKSETVGKRVSLAVFTDTDVWVRASALNMADSTRFYRNGIPAGGAIPFSLKPATNSLVLGAREPYSLSTYRFNGWIDRTIIADTAISRIRRNTYMISKRELPTSVRDTTSGIVWIDTAGNQCDSIKVWNPTQGKTAKFKVVAGNLYNITAAFTLDTTYQDSTVIAEGIQRTLNIHSRDTLRYAGINDVATGDSTEYVQDFYKAVTETLVPGGNNQMHIGIGITISQLFKEAHNAAVQISSRLSGSVLSFLRRERRPVCENRPGFHRKGSQPYARVYGNPRM